MEREILVGGLEHEFCFSIYWECHHPNWLISFRWVAQPPTRIDSHFFPPWIVVNLVTFINLPRGHRGKSRSERIYKWWKPHLAAFFQGSSMEKPMCFVGKMTYKWLIPCIYTGRYHELVGWWIVFVGQLIYMVILDDIGPWCFFERTGYRRKLKQWNMMKPQMLSNFHQTKVSTLTMCFGWF